MRVRKGIGVSLVSVFGLVVLVVGLLLAPVLAAAASTVGLLGVAVALVVVGRWSSMGR